MGLLSWIANENIALLSADWDQARLDYRLYRMCFQQNSNCWSKSNVITALRKQIFWIKARTPLDIQYFLFTKDRTNVKCLTRGLEMMSCFYCHWAGSGESACASTSKTRQCFHESACARMSTTRQCYHLISFTFPLIRKDLGKFPP